jgi:ubiquinone/menaquinone biosynthesis C-methylase UbiE
MTHPDHVDLIKAGITKNSGGIWADFGSGDGAFTLALRDIAGPAVEIYSVDADQGRLQNQQRTFDRMFPETNMHYLTADFTGRLHLPPLDGLIAANSIHYTPDTRQTFQHLATFLKPGGSFIVIEYNTTSGNTWVPYPFTFPEFTALAQQTDLLNPELLATIPSQFLKEIYAAKAIKKTDTQ